MHPELSEAERFPLLTQRGRELLSRMRQHERAPIWNWPNGEQLNEQGLHRVHTFAEELVRHRKDETQQTAWLEDFVERCLAEVPFYRKRHRPGTPFEQLTTCNRADLAPRVWEFVPDSEPLDEVIVFSSSGTTGHPTRTAHHPYSAACGLPLIEHALRLLHGIELLREPDHVAITNVVAYPEAYTTAIVAAYLREAGIIRVNLDPSAWRNSGDCAAYINHWKAPIWLGDPVAFGRLEQLSIEYAPQAIVSSILQLTDQYADHLKNKYGCPVLDLYAMTEAGIIAVRDHLGHRVLPHDLFVEILDEFDNHCPPGIRGEITLTGGRNPFLPLLRYRTGDHAALQIIGGKRILVDFVGRQNVEYATADGRNVHSMEINRLMRRHPVRRYEVRGSVQGYELVIDGEVDRVELLRQIRELLGSKTKLIEY